MIIELQSPSTLDLIMNMVLLMKTDLMEMDTLERSLIVMAEWYILLKMKVSFTMHLYRQLMTLWKNLLKNLMD